MRIFVAILSSLVLITVASTAFAQQQPRRSGLHGDWGTYNYDSTGGKVCFVLTVPTGKQPASLNHGDVYFMVSQRPGQSVSYEPQFVAGYNLREGTKVAITIGNRNFTMFNDGRNVAWLENAAEETQLIAAMRGGATMTLEATSGRGNATSYNFSLNGITAALNSIQTCR